MVVLADGTSDRRARVEERLIVRLGEQRTLLGVLPEATFFRTVQGDLCFVGCASRTSC